MSVGYRGKHRRPVRRGHRALGIVALVTALAAAALLQIPGAEGAFTARVTNTGNSAASNPFFTCTAYAQATGALNPYFAYPFSDAAGSGLTAADVSGNNRSGSYSSVLNLGVPILSGVTLGVANSGTGAVCPRDSKTVITLDGANGYVSGPTAVQVGPNVFTEEIWFKTNAAQGKLIGFGDARTGRSNSNDRSLYLDNNGHVIFGVYPGSVKTVSSPKVYTDNSWHFAAATLSPAGMVLYMDGVQVAADATTTTAQPFSGYWRIGYDNNDGWPSEPPSYYFKGQLAFAAVYTSALTGTQVQAQYFAGR